MSGLESFAIGIGAVAAQPQLWLLMIVGSLFGIVFGAIPGLTGALAVTVLLPFTYAMGDVDGITLLIAVYVGSTSGGLISACLLNIPGTPSAVCTTFDGAPMARNGHPEDALMLGTFSSLIGGLFAGICLIFISPLLARVALIFGSWEYFAMAFMGLCVVVSLTSKDRIKGFMSALIGLALASVGMDAVTGVARLTFGNWQLNAGIATLPALMGLFALAEVLKQLRGIDQDMTSIEFKKMGLLPSRELIRGTGKTMGISAIIGTLVGILPGVGSSTASMISYNQAVQMSSTPEKFGTGCKEGVVASEAANNAVCGGALIPMMALGIPGDVITAVLLGALVVHGIQPGPQLFTNNGGLVGMVFVTYILANIVMYLLLLVLMRVFVQIIKVPLQYLLPIIMLMCIVGAVTTNNRVFDAWCLLIIGVVSYLLLSQGLSAAPIVLGFILGSLLETNLRTAIIAGKGSASGLFGHPIAMVLMAIGILMVVWEPVKGMLRKKKSKTD
ncbi:MAG: tripartite tricarboxylate transporter permease [Bacteroides thetaiotaomicron]|nr:tripartite tricarboxylate transporter permease [Bacteroides thetaiotaomicron]